MGAGDSRRPGPVSLGRSSRSRHGHPRGFARIRGQRQPASGGLALLRDVAAQGLDERQGRARPASCRAAGGLRRIDRCGVLPASGLRMPRDVPLTLTGPTRNKIPFSPSYPRGAGKLLLRRSGARETAAPSGGTELEGTPMVSAAGESGAASRGGGPAVRRLQLRFQGTQGRLLRLDEENNTVPAGEPERIGSLSRARRTANIVCGTPDHCGRRRRLLRRRPGQDRRAGQVFRRARQILQKEQVLRIGTTQPPQQQYGLRSAEIGQAMDRQQLPRSLFRGRR